ncbi:hypothetical protein V498_06734, partial [Pseudogymnoascus sp. VKM F-4517 (FW-2822)]
RDLTPHGDSWSHCARFYCVYSRLCWLVVCLQGDLRQATPRTSYVLSAHFLKFDANKKYPQFNAHNTQRSAFKPTLHSCPTLLLGSLCILSGLYPVHHALNGNGRAQPAETFAVYISQPGVSPFSVPPRPFSAPSTEPPFDSGPNEEMKRRYENDVIEDPNLDGASIDDVRDAFTKWLKDNGVDLEVHQLYARH